MHLDLGPFVALWLVVLAGVVVVFYWRRSLVVQEDPTLHLGADLGSPAQQIALTKKLERVNMWFKILVVVAVVLGILLAAASLYNGWVSGTGGA